MNKRMKALTIDEVVNICAKYFDVSPEYFSQDTRRREIVEKRQIVHWLCVNFTNKTYKEIGQAVGGRDHATVTYAKAKIKELTESNYKLKPVYEELYNKIKVITDNPATIIGNVLTELRRCVRNLETIGYYPQIVARLDITIDKLKEDYDKYIYRSFDN
jgi:hypothetical protein